MPWHGGGDAAVEDAEIDMRDLEAQAQFQRERLHSAAQAGDLASVERWLTAKYPVNRFDFIGKTPLHYAVGGGHLAVVRRLLRAGANVNAHDERWIGDTPLADHVGTMSLAMLELLVDAGADPTIRGWMRRTALDRAGNRTDADATTVMRRLEAAAEATHKAADVIRGRRPDRR